MVLTMEQKGMSITSAKSLIHPIFRKREIGAFDDRVVQFLEFIQADKCAPWIAKRSPRTFQRIVAIETVIYVAEGQRVVSSLPI